MDHNALPLLGHGVDFTKVPALDQKLLQAYTNAFLSESSKTLCGYAARADAQISRTHFEIQQLETLVSILETKLTSIPGVDLNEPVPPGAFGGNPNENVSPNNAQAQLQPQPQSQAQPHPPPQASGTQAQSQDPAASGAAGTQAQATPAPQATDAEAAPSSAAASVLTVKDHPDYIRFFKMKDYGIPVAAIKLKMSSEGADPNYLDTPNAPAPQVRAPAAAAPPLLANSDDSSNNSDDDE